MVQEKAQTLRIRHKPVSYEGIPACSAIGMALFESSGLRALVDSRCTFDPARRTLSPGMVIKVLLGPMFDDGHKTPLYTTDRFYAAAPVDRLFGPRVERSDIYDAALARGLDTLFNTCDLESLFSECSDMLVERFGFRSDIRHIDATDFSLYCMERPETGDGAAVPRRSGHPKDGRRDLLQLKMQLVTDSNRIIRQWRAYSGNTSDVVMNRDSLDFIADHVPQDERRRMTVVGDCKLVDEKLIDRIESLGLGFVSRCPANFGNLAMERAVEAALSEGRPPLGEDGRHHDIMVDLDLTAEFGKGVKGRSRDLRFVVLVEQWKVDQGIARITERLEAEARKPFARVIGRSFSSPELAERHLSALRSDKGICRAVPHVVAEERKKSGRPSDGPRTETWYKVEFDYEVDDAAVRALAEREAAFVHITNLPRMEDGVDAPGYRGGASAQDVIDLYREEYVVEHSFRLTKSGLGIDEVYLQTPSRENAMMFVVAVAALLKSVADAVFRCSRLRLGGNRLTMHNLEVHLRTMQVLFSRQTMELFLQAGKGDVYDVDLFDVTDELRINPQYLLGYTDD